MTDTQRHRIPKIRKQPVGMRPPWLDDPSGFYRPGDFVVLASGLRRDELEQLRVRDITVNQEGLISIHVPKRTSRTSERDVLVLPEYQQKMLTIAQDAKVLERLPHPRDILSLRRRYARSLYEHLLTGTREPHEYDEATVREVMKALGHNDRDVVARYYLGLQDAS